MYCMESSYYLEIELDGLPKRYNELARKAGFKQKMGERRKWVGAIGRATFGKRPKKPLEKARVKCIRFSSVCPDYDGLVSSFKFVIDALVELGILVDDNMQVIGMPEFVWEKAPPKKGKIKIIVDGNPDLS